MIPKELFICGHRYDVHLKELDGILGEAFPWESKIEIQENASFSVQLQTLLHEVCHIFQGLYILFYVDGYEEEERRIKPLANAVYQFLIWNEPLTCIFLNVDSPDVVREKFPSELIIAGHRFCISLERLWSDSEGELVKGESIPQQKEIKVDSSMSPSMQLQILLREFLCSCDDSYYFLDKEYLLRQSRILSNAFYQLLTKNPDLIRAFLRLGGEDSSEADSVEEQ